MAKLMNIGFGNMVNTDKIRTGKAHDLPWKRAGDFDRCDAGKKNQECDFYRK